MGRDGRSASGVDVGEVKKIAIIGARTMGSGRAQVFAGAGHPVALHRRTAAALEKARAVSAANTDTFVRHDSLAAESVPELLGRITPTRSLEEAGSEASLVLESVAEDLEAKRSVFGDPDSVRPAHAVFTSNTSCLNVYAVVTRRRLPQTVIAHWFTPPQIVPLVELVKGPQTSRLRGPRPGGYP